MTTEEKPLVNPRLYTAADARAEMNRAVKSCEAALRTIAAAVEQLREIGKASGFEKDAETARLVLMGRAARALGVPAPAAPEKPGTPPTEAAKTPPAAETKPEPPPVPQPAKKARSKPGPGRLQVDQPERARVRE